jgi:hypothetical protein
VPVPEPQSGLAQADAGFSICFKRADAVVFQATGCRALKVSNLGALGEEILNRYSDADPARRWAPTDVVITEVLTTKATTILISNGRDARIDLAVRAQEQTPTKKLADADVKMDVARASGIGTRIVSTRNLTPLFRCNGIRKSMFRPPLFVRRSADEFSFIELGYKDLLGGAETGS